MPDTKSYEPEDLPEEFLAYDKKVKQLGVGQAGKTGAIRITLEKDEHTHRTVATELFSQVPLQVQKTLYIDESLPGMAYVYMMSPSGGILQGDRLRIDVELENGAYAHITTQAATKVYRMNRNYATQMVNGTVGKGCYLEFIPDQLIPYRNARFYQRVRMQVHEDATAVYSEIITPGRVARGEYFEYDTCCFRTVATDQNSKLRFMDTFLLEPKRQNLPDQLLLGRSVVANLYVLTKSADVDALSDAIHAILDKSSVNGSASVLPLHDGVYARMIAGTAGEIRDVMDVLLNKIRNDVLQKQFAGVRKY